MSSADLIRELKQAGWRLARVNGSHHVFTHPQHTGIVVVPHPKKDLGIGLEKAMAELRASGQLLALFQQQGMTLTAP